MEYFEPEEADLAEAEALLQRNAVRSRKYRIGKKWPTLLAACLLTAALGIAAAAAGQGQDGWLASYFHVSEEKTGALLEQLGADGNAAAEDAGYRIEVAESASDGYSIFAVLKVTATEGAAFDDRQYALSVIPWEASDKPGNERFLQGGGYIEELERIAQDQAVFLYVWDVSETVSKKQIVLKISEITAYGEDGTEETVAQGQWDLRMEFPKSETRMKRQWTKLTAGEDIYYVSAVGVTPFGIRIRAIKAVSFGTLWRTAAYGVKKYILGQNAGLPAGWTKESFEQLAVTVVYEDGSKAALRTQSSAGSGFFCEKSVLYEEKGIVDPDRIKEVWLGDTPLKLK